ncbi:hypothetical protein K3495_g895 [Podosphaera aphanis]|nr:hypothetical protein K3495_g895 [Podosphaera aphanis]
MEKFIHKPLSTSTERKAENNGPEFQADNETDDDDNMQILTDSAYNKKGLETPITPISPSRKKFPSELKNFRCTYAGCCKKFNRPAKLAAHMRSHTNERPFVCNFEGCGKSYLQDKHLKHHIKSSHTQERNFQCEWEDCKKKFLTATRLKRHLEVHRGQDRFRCTEFPPCDQTFRKHQTLQRHIRSDHFQLAPYPCTYVDPVTGEACTSGFDGMTGLRQHEERVHSTARYFCSECTSTGTFNPDGTPTHPGFFSHNRLQAHIRKEHPICVFCNVKCRSQRELLSHIDSQHSGKSLSERQKFPCNEPGCNKRFTKQYNLNTHVRTVHLGKRFICGTFDLHAEPMVPNWSSSINCGSDFNSKKSLINHVRTAHLQLPSLDKLGRSNCLEISTRLTPETSSSYRIDYLSDDGQAILMPG